MNRWKGIALGTAIVACMVPVLGQGTKQSGAEIGMLGVQLFDKSQLLLQKYGSPDELLPVTINASQSGGSTAGAGSVPGAPGGQRQGGGGSTNAAADWNIPIFGGETLKQKGRGGNQAPPIGEDSNGQRGGQTMGGPPPGFQGPPGMPGQAGPGANIPGGSTQSSGLVQMTRWVYNRDNNKYGFIVDKYGRIVQIEAIGLENKKIKTRRGITLGSNFAQVLRAYQNPDAYEISGENIVLRYLSRNKIAFRLSRLGTKKPQVVTGIVIAAAKA